MVAAIDYPTDCNRASSDCDRSFRRRQNDGTAYCQPGLFKHAARFRGLAADAVYGREGENGRVRKPCLDKNSRLDNCRHYHRAECEAAAGHVFTGVRSQRVLQFSRVTNSKVNKMTKHQLDSVIRYTVKLLRRNSRFNDSTI